MCRIIVSIFCMLLAASAVVGQVPLTPMTAQPQVQAPLAATPLSNGSGQPIHVYGDLIVQQPPGQAPGEGGITSPHARQVLQEHQQTILERFYQDDLFHYTWIDFGEAPGLRVHRIEMTNAWADLRAAQFFSRPISFDAQRFHAGLSFSVQWWKDQLNREINPTESNLPPVVYDLYADFGYRVAISPTWVIDLALSPGLTTDFRVTPPDGFRMKGHAITMLDMLPGLRGVLGVTYLNRESLKLLPVAGLAVDVTERTRIEAIFPQPRLLHTLGEWRGTTWDFSLGGEFGGGSWAYKNWDNDRETIDYRDLRALVGLNWNNRKGQGSLQVGYVFHRELTYGIQSQFNFDPGNAWMVRLGWDF